MRKPVARPTKPAPAKSPSDQAAETTSRRESEEAPQRPPRAFAPPETVEPLADLTDTDPADDLVAPAVPRRHWFTRLAVATAGILLSLGLWLAVDALIRDLFARYDWLGWVALTAAGLFALALIVIIAREIASVRRLAKLDHLREEAKTALAANIPAEARAVTGRVQALYAARADLARPRAELDETLTELLDGADMITAAEYALMAPLDARARRLIAASARRVALVTAISPRALVDLAFVTYESAKLARAIASLYGARPGLIGSWRLAGAVLSHLAITGGVALGDSVVQQLLGQGLAQKLSAKLGEGLVNGLMTARVGIAAMRVTRPLPFAVLKQPVVMEFMPELAKIGAGADDKNKA